MIISNGGRIPLSYVNTDNISNLRVFAFSLSDKAYVESLRIKGEISLENFQRDFT